MRPYEYALGNHADNESGDEAELLHRSEQQVQTAAGVCVLMRSDYVRALCCFLVGVISHGAMADDATQRDRFAVYCFAVLDAEVEKLKAAPDRCYQTETTSACQDRTAGILRALNDARYRRERFLSYLFSRATAGNPVLTDATDLYRNRGTADFKACQEYRDKHFERTAHGCATFCRGDNPGAECRQCFELAQPAVCQSIARCNDPSLLPF